MIKIESVSRRDQIHLSIRTGCHYDNSGRLVSSHHKGLTVPRIACADLNAFTEKMSTDICAHKYRLHTGDDPWLIRTVVQQEQDRPVSTWVSHPDVGSGEAPRSTHTTQRSLAILITVKLENFKGERCPGPVVR